MKQYTMDDFKEIRPGFHKLIDQNIYVEIKGTLENCGACGGKGKYPAIAKSGRKSWRQCGRCDGTGRCHPSDNIEVPRPAGATCWAAGIYTMATSWESIFDTLNSGYGGWFNQPAVFIKLL